MSRSPQRIRAIMSRLYSDGNQPGALTAKLPLRSTGGRFLLAHSRTNSLRPETIILLKEILCAKYSRRERYLVPRNVNFTKETFRRCTNLATTSLTGFRRGGRKKTKISSVLFRII